MQKKKKSSNRPVQYKSSKLPREKEEVWEMKDAFMEMEDAVELHDAGEYACAVKKFKKVRKIAYWPSLL